MRLKPAGFRVLVKPDEWEALGEKDKDRGEIKRDSGIVIPADSEFEKDNLREKSANSEGTVVAVGPTAWKAFDAGEPWAKVGDRVVYAKYGGRWVKDSTDEEEYVLLSDEDVLCVVGGE